MNIKHDRELDVALGNSRKCKTWKNRKMNWSELLDKMSQTVRTKETVAEYKAMDREAQADRKDHGGFVGGYCKDGNRTQIEHRSVLCLDADFADSELWDDWSFTFGTASAIYSTHKHTPENPRLRLVIPLARDVSPDEYQAIGRKIAETLGMDKFDDTSYQPQRVMFWASTSSDGQFVFEYIDAPLLDPDEILGMYHDWKDVSSWAVSSRLATAIKHDASIKQKDPLTKNGIVGAFCRAYTITEAIETFVPDYQPCSIPGRYTYVNGSTAAGVLTYDDKFSYSHHATDPASMQLCNAWDVVRLHMFGDLDFNAPANTLAINMPSYKAMVDLATKDKNVTAQIVLDKLSEVSDDFKDSIPDDVETEEDDGAYGNDVPPDDSDDSTPDSSKGPDNDDGTWVGELKITPKGAIASNIDNVVIILTKSKDFKGCLAYNEMDHNIVVLKDLPWRKVTKPSPWTDTDDAALRYHLERGYEISGKDRIFDAVNVVATQNSFHPVRDYLDSCEWDGVKRLDTLLVDYLGADDNDYTRAVTRKTFVAAVARIYEPGVKFDYMLTLKGKQGIGKSTLIAKLAGQWFSDTFVSMQGKDAYEQIQGVWVMEVGELAGMKKAEAETIKLYISKQTDRFRPAYGRRTQEFPRQCIFIGTTNESQFLRDTTGNRRFWIVDTPNPALEDMWELTAEDIKQIWAEAVEYYKNDEPLFLPREIEALARDIQETYEEENPRLGLVLDYLDRKLPVGWEDMDLYSRKQWLDSSAEGSVERKTVSAIEIWTEALDGSSDRIDRYGVKEIRDIMSKLPEWVHQGNARISTKLYGRQRYFKKVSAE